MSDLYLGIDTSNYKTSAAVTDSEGNILFERSEFLEVARGSRGLRQSEAFFMHSNRLPSFIDELCNSIDTGKLRAVGVSSRPRRVEGSYMPCFLAGVNAASEIASVLDIPLHKFSHQEGHAAAVIENNGFLPEKTSALFHLSGGTTEMLLCTPDEHGYHTEIAGGTRDISIGQLVDRAGVAMGYPFPAGSCLDELAMNYQENFTSKGSRTGTGFRLPAVKISDGYFNLSGIETKTLRHIETSPGDEYPETAYVLFTLIAGLLSEAASYTVMKYDVDTVYMAGGVSASSFIRHQITCHQQAGGTYKIVFGEPALSGDNAVGIARLADRMSRNNQK